MKVHCVPDSCIRFFYSDWTQILTDHGQVPESRGGTKGKQPRQFITCLLSCFMSLLFRLFGVDDDVLYHNFYPNWIMDVSVFHSDYYCDISDSNTQAAHCFSGFDLHLFCMLVANINSSSAYSFCNNIYLSDQCWRLALFFRTWREATSDEFWITLLMKIRFRFSPMATLLCMKRPKMDLTFFKSCTLILKHFEKNFSWRCRIS